MPNSMDISPVTYRSSSSTFKHDLFLTLTEQIQYAQETGNMHVISKAQLDAYIQYLLQRVPPQNTKMVTAFRFFMAFTDFVYDVILGKKQAHTRDFDDRIDLVVYFSQICDLKLTHDYKKYADGLIQTCLYTGGDVSSFMQRIKRNIAIDAAWETYTRPLIALLHVYQRHGVFQQIKTHIHGIKNKSRYNKHPPPTPSANIQDEEDEMEEYLKSINPDYKKRKDIARQRRQKQTFSTMNQLKKDKEYLDSVNQMKQQKRQYAPPPPPRPTPGSNWDMPRANTRSNRPGPAPQGPTPQPSRPSPRANARSNRPGPGPGGPTPRTNAKTMRTSPRSFNPDVEGPLIEQEIEDMFKNNKPLAQIRKAIMFKYHPDKNPGSQARATRKFQYANNILEHLQKK